MRFHMIDRIDGWEPDRRLTGRKVTSAVEDFWESTPGGRPRMPRPLVLESLAQAGTWLLMLSTDHARRGALLSLGEVTFLGDVHPGDVLLLDVAITSLSADTAVLDGTVHVAGEQPRPVLTATDIICAVIEAERLDDPAATRRMAGQLLGTGALR
jgi:3-hydroxyacyl-[acyl-carrier-protein] dehydratase